MRLFRIFLTLIGLLLVVITATPLLPWAAQSIAVDWYEGDADVLVVLGGSMLVDGTGPEAAMGYDSYLRCTYAAWNLQQHHYRYIILSGPDGLAEAMSHFLAARGANPHQLLTENSARTTSENAAFVKNILERQPGLSPRPTVAILTSDYHSHRARLVFQHYGLPVRVIPVPDLAKRAGFPLQRWDGFLDLTDELFKTAYYQITGKL